MTTEHNPRYRITGIPEGESGIFKIVHFTRDTIHNCWQMYLNGKGDTDDGLGGYTVLIKETCPMPIMQDSQAEYTEHGWLWANATGHVLVGGLGIGYVNDFLLNSDDVTSVTIVEDSQDVIDLVWEHCAKDDRFTIVKADFETWIPPDGVTYDVVWCDTWLVDNPIYYPLYRQTMLEHYSPYLSGTGQIAFWGMKG